MNVSFHSVTGSRKRRRGFTLIELLTVIVIIGILATLTVGVAGLVARKSKENRTRVELRQIETAIRAYHSKFGFYPPDNVVVYDESDPGAIVVDPAINQLFYELSGAVYDRSSGLYIVGSEDISRADFLSVFGSQFVGGIYNSSESAANVQDFLADARGTLVDHISESPHVDGLVTPVPWPNADNGPIPGSTVNPWRYVSTIATNNPGEFDLWAEIVIGNDVIVIGNWDED